MGTGPTMPSNHTRRVQSLIRRGILDANNPRELTPKGERLAEELHDPHWADPPQEFDGYGEYGYDPGDDLPA